MNVPKSGQAWPQLEQEVDKLVETVIKEKNLPGMTVAITQGGRLLLSKGYGYALVDGARKLPMKPCSRTLIGSVTKALITGPSGYQLMKSKNIKPETQKLYGSNGLFKGMFDADIDIGIKAHAPKSAKWKQWYEKITIQHLLDHKAGFERDTGHLRDAAKMFGVSEDAVTPEHQHRHFLRTKELRYEPGNPPPELTKKEIYSNHGFGLWAILIKQMSGKPYANYVRGHYLRPFNLHNAVRWQRENPDSCDAYAHRINSNQQFEALPFAESPLGIGLAAGGFAASAESVVRLTASLDKRYTVEQLDSMGWEKGSRGRLDHGGKITGGRAHVVMLPDGFRSSAGNLDLSEVHVAVATNIEIKESLQSLANDIAIAVPTSNVPATFNLWKQNKPICSCEYVRRGIPTSEYQKLFDEADRSGYRLEWIDGYTVGGKVHFNVIFRTNSPEIAWVSHHNLTGATYQQHFDKYSNEGFSLAHVDSYVVNNNVLYAAIWTKSGDIITAYHGKTADDHQKTFDSLTKDGWSPKVLSVASVAGKLWYTGLYSKQLIGKSEARSFLTPEEYQIKFDQNKENDRQLHYLNTYLHEGKIRFSAIWAEQPKVLVRARHGLIDKQFLPLWEDALSANFRTRALTATEVGGKVQYAVYWTQ